MSFMKHERHYFANNNSVRVLGANFGQAYDHDTIACSVFRLSFKFCSENGSVFDFYPRQNSSSQLCRKSTFGSEKLFESFYKK